MATRQQPQRREDEPSFVLHTYAYRETSLIVEAFTEAHGRVALIARGAKRPRSETRGLLQAFAPLLLSWSGAGELKTLQKAQWRGGLPPLSGSALLCGFYLNELLLKLLAREDSHTALYGDYAAALAALGTPAGQGGGQQAAILRRFEVRLLAELGYALVLTHDVDSGAAVEPGSRYHYVFDRGPRLAASREVRDATWRQPLVRGVTLLALAGQAPLEGDSAIEARRLMREVLDHYLEERRIFSRRVVQDLQALDEEGSAS